MGRIEMDATEREERQLPTTSCLSTDLGALSRSLSLSLFLSRSLVFRGGWKAHSS